MLSKVLVNAGHQMDFRPKKALGYELIGTYELVRGSYWRFGHFDCGLLSRPPFGKRVQVGIDNRGQIQRNQL